MVNIRELPIGGAVTVFAPHPDDEVFGCGGLLSLLAELGKAIRVIVVSDGGFGEYGKDVAARKQESIAAGSILGYTAIEFWDLPDQGLSRDIGLSEKIFNELNDNPASLVLAPSPWEIHPDHVAVCQATIKAICKPLHTTPYLWLYEVGVPIPRPFVIDISSSSKQKSEAMNCFKSQLLIQDYANQIAGLNKYRGYTLPQFGASGEAYFSPNVELLRNGHLELLTDLLSKQPAPFQEARTSSLEQALSEILVENIRLKTECDALYTSTSWKITSPMRKVVLRLRRLFKS